MNIEQRGGQYPAPELPHHGYMDNTQLDFVDLPIHIQDEISNFNDKFDLVIRQGYLNDQHEKEIVYQSYQIVKLILAHDLGGCTLKS